MKIIVAALLFFSFFNTTHRIEERDRDFILKSLHFFDEELCLHLERTNLPIIVSYNKQEFVCFEFTNKRFLSLKKNKDNRVKSIYYELDQVDGEKFEFTLQMSSIYKGNFNVVENDGKYRFSNLRYVLRGCDLIPLKKK